jgi:hypothetical protein
MKARKVIRKIVTTFFIRATTKAMKVTMTLMGPIKSKWMNRRYLPKKSMSDFGWDKEKARDYDIHGIQYMEKNKGKKLKGSRKQKEEKVAGDVSGTNFKVDVNDDCFKAILDGSGNRFGIDKTDPNFKDTSAMQEIFV